MWDFFVDEHLVKLLLVGVHNFRARVLQDSNPEDGVRWRLTIFPKLVIRSIKHCLKLYVSLVVTQTFSFLFKVKRFFVKTLKVWEVSLFLLFTFFRNTEYNLAARFKLGLLELKETRIATIPQPQPRFCLLFASPCVMTCILTSQVLSFVQPRLAISSKNMAWVRQFWTYVWS